MEYIPANTQIHEHTVGGLSVSVSVSVRVSVSVSVKSPSLGKVPVRECITLMKLFGRKG